MNNIKKTLVLVLALVAVIGLMTVCASAEEVEHVCAENLEKVAAVEPTCHVAGHGEYYQCTECGAVFADEKGEQLSNVKNFGISATALKYVEEVPATCTEAGVKAHYYCSECDAHFVYGEGTNLQNVGFLSLTIEPHSELTHVEAVEATCHSNGNIEHWYCETCGYHEVEGGVASNAMAVITPATGEFTTTKVEAVAPTCCKTGLDEHYVCDKCDGLFLDAEGTQGTTLPSVTVPATKLEYVEEVPATCETAGVAEHFYCSECDVHYTADENGNLHNIAYLSLTIEPHSNLTHVEAVEATCCKNGNIEYWYCEECGFASTSADGTELTNLKNVIVPATKLEYVAEVAATCETNGVAAHYYCSECENFYVADDNGNMMNVAYLSLTIVPHSTGLTHVEAVAATCHVNGNVEFWFCEECGFASTSADGTELTNLKNVITPATDLVYVAEVAATATTNGMKAHYYCPTCDVYFVTDDNGNLINIARLSLVIPAYGESDIPQTGLVWWPVAALSLAGAGMIAVGAVKTKKERDEE